MPTLRLTLLDRLLGRSAMRLSSANVPIDLARQPLKDSTIAIFGRVIGHNEKRS
ncbi:hypothetical protein [Chamaesiphon sp.]|uniref:hypothetical protein n=1 Tax=Chamaesiphon sp. TaxID=2814140 RepID=UPI003593B00B